MQRAPSAPGRSQRRPGMSGICEIVSRARRPPGPRAPVRVVASGFPHDAEGGAVTKSEFVDQVSRDAAVSKKEAEKAVESVLGAIESTLRRGGEVNFTGFGKFYVAERGGRQG